MLMKLGQHPMLRVVEIFTPMALAALSYAAAIYLDATRATPIIAAVSVVGILAAISSLVGWSISTRAAAVAIAVWTVGYYDVIAGPTFLAVWIGFSFFLSYFGTLRAKQNDKGTGFFEWLIFEWLAYQVFFGTTLFAVTYPAWRYERYAIVMLVGAFCLFLAWAFIAGRKERKRQEQVVVAFNSKNARRRRA